MPSHLCITLRFLHDAFHGRGEGQEPEWPPSPLRLFQALVRTAAGRWAPDQFSARAKAVFGWLESLPAPIIVAPRARPGAAYRLSVPNNAMDIVAGAWARGNLSAKGDANPATHRTMKTVRPMCLPADSAVHYLWALPENAPDEVLGHVEALVALARGLAAVGWGTDLVAGHARVLPEDEAASLPGDRWLPASVSGGSLLRVPRAGTLSDLVERHAAFLRRLPPGGGFIPVPPLSAFDVVSYRRAVDPPQRRFAAFQLLTPSAERMRAFSPVRDLRRVVGMTRDALQRAARGAGWPQEQIARVVLGHGEALGRPHTPVTSGRLAYLPIPTLEGRGEGKSLVVGAVRRILITSLEGACEHELAWIRRALSGMDLRDEASGTTEAVLSLIPDSDPRLRSYAGRRPAATWATVTPMVLPGYDDRHQGKADELIRKAIRQAGFSDVLARHAEFEWRKVGYWRGVDLALCYRVPDYLLNFPRYHVRITWRDTDGQPVPICGPLCLGGGRFVGLGLFAALED